MDLNNIKDFRKLIQLQMKEADNKDLEQIENLKKEIQNYDIYDFLAGVSALNLIPRNQSKSVIFNCIISATLSIPLDEINFNNKMGISKFKTIIKSFENLSIKRIIDPAEFPFIQKLIYYKNYDIFMGVSNIASEDIQLLLNVLRDNYSILSVDSLNKLNTSILTLLELSTSISKKINYNYNHYDKYSYDDDIFIPCKQELENLKQLMKINIKDLSKFCYDESEYSNFFCDLNCCSENDYLDFNNQYYYFHPMLQICNEEFLILDISIFPVLLMNKIVSIILKDENGKNLIEKYGNYAWQKIGEYFSWMDSKKIKEKSFGLELISNNNYKERLLSLGNNGIIINLGLFDEGEHFDSEKIGSNYNANISAKFIDERIDYIVEKLLTIGAKKDNIILIICPVGLGRNTYLGFNSEIQTLMLRSYEIRSIAINESEQNLFLKRYILAKEKLKHFIPNSFSELNLISMYVSKDYSFYFNDDVDIKETSLWYTGEFSAEYILKADNKINEHLIESYEPEYNCVVVRDERNIYVWKNNFKDNRLNVCVETNKFLIWIITDILSDSNTLLIYKNFMDFLSYWLDEYFSVYNEFPYLSNIVIELRLKGSIEEFYKKTSEKFELKDILSIKSDDSKKIIFEIYPSFTDFIDCKTNENEKILFKYILEQISNVNNIKILENDYINLIFENPDKKRAVTLNYGEFSYLKPFSSNKQRLISCSDENIILDDLGLYTKNVLGIDYGKLDDLTKDELPKKIVDKLYNEIHEELKKYDKSQTLKVLYFESERILSNLMILKESYINNVACFSECKIDIDKRYNELSKSSLAIKFIIELFSSIQHTENNLIGEYDLEFLMAKSSQLIDWAYKNDLYHYKILDVPIKLLKSNRIGMDQDKFIETNNAFNRLREEQMGSFGRDKMLLLKSGFVAEKIDDSNFREIFKTEFGYSMNELFEFFEYLTNKCDETKKEICELEIEILKSEIANKINLSVLDKILSQFSLTTRDDFLKPPVPFRQEDVYPWRFNRRLSFVRRPIILYDNKILWGNRNLSNSIFYLFDLINEGKLKCNTKTMKDYISKINNVRGRNFNNLVFKYISEFNELTVDKNVSKINGKDINNSNGMTLGDIDVLYIYPKKKKIVLVETKNFNSVKNYYELYNEYLNLFVDNKYKKSFLTKHKRRVDWVKEHIDDVIKHYSLPNGNYKVCYMFVTSEYCTANDVFKIKEKIYSIKELDEKIILNIK